MCTRGNWCSGEGLRSVVEWLLFLRKSAVSVFWDVEATAGKGSGHPEPFGEGAGAGREQWAALHCS